MSLELYTVKMMSPLLQAQVQFSTLLGKLLDYAASQNIPVTMGECWRPPEMEKVYIAEGRSWTRHSRHLTRLAVDLNQFTADGQPAAGVDYAALGQYWTSLNPACVYGGQWTQKDYGHFEFYPDTIHGLC